MNESVFDRVIREDNGGCNPWVDSVIRLKAKIEDKRIQVFVVGKWRSIRYWSRPTPPKTLKVKEDMISSILINTGWLNDTKLPPKPVEFIWVK